MKKFKFSLETVLNYRKMIEENEKNLLMKMNGELMQLFNELNILRNSRESETANFEQALVTGMTVQEILSKQGIIKNIEYAIEKKIAEIQEQQRRVDKQTEVVVKATQDKKTIEKLRENSVKKYNKAVAKAEEQFIEEFVSYQTQTANVK